MKLSLRLLLAAGASTGLLFGCAAPEPAYTPSPFTPVKIDTSGYIAKVNAFAVVVDASTSMGGDRPYKFLFEKDLANRLNQTIPPLGYEASLIAFGAGKCVKDQMAWQVTGPARYSESDIAGGIGAVKCTSGWSPLESAIDKAGELLSPVSGHTALVIFSDFKKLETKAVTASAKKLKDSMGARLCIHPVQIGNDPGGKTLADELAAIGGCGPAVNADSIASGEGMAGFVRGALLAPKPPPPPAPVVMDSDGDGVPNDRDKCPNTPRGVRVTAEGCWVLAGENVLFATNSARITDTVVLDDAVKILEANPVV